MEYANNGTLSQYLSKNFDKMDWNLKLKFASQISNAILCLHNNDIIHRDLVNTFFKKFFFSFFEMVNNLLLFYKSMQTIFLFMKKT